MTKNKFLFLWLLPILLGCTSIDRAFVTKTGFIEAYDPFEYQVLKFNKNGNCTEYKLGQSTIDQKILNVFVVEEGPYFINRDTIYYFSTPNSFLSPEKYFLGKNQRKRFITLCPEKTERQDANVPRIRTSREFPELSRQNSKKLKRKIKESKARIY